MLAVERHASLGILLLAAAVSGWDARDAAAAVAATLSVYLLVNRRWGRMAATAAAFFCVIAVGASLATTRAVGALASPLLGVGSSLAYQRAEARYLIPWARRRTPFLLERTRRATLLWSATLLVVTLASLWLARFAAQ